MHSSLHFSIRLALPSQHNDEYLFDDLIRLSRDNYINSLAKDFDFLNNLLKRGTQSVINLNIRHGNTTENLHPLFSGS
ncbi:TPA: hypothetical protein I7665_14270 [Vibrio vulnificus]|nr:hypothetical protein D8T57_00660 [Vibrio vulnificus]HAS8123268.1 hypothetical protein [Vibrio vulnificus]HAS8321174.1 hypothetical protein [Vibrio vulnificus]